MTRVDIEQLGLEFPGQVVPSMLLELCQFQEHNQSYAYSGDFIVENEASEFTLDLPSRRSFVAFATDLNGSVFSFWSGDENDLANSAFEECPIVYLDSEAVFSTVVSVNFQDFVGLLLLGVDDLGSKIAKEMALEPATGNENTDKFRSWAQDLLDVALPESPYELINHAKRRYQTSFVSWYKTWQGEAPWTKMIKD